MANSSSDPVRAPVDVYWRPGCPFCMSLRVAMKRARIPARRHNIWDDPAAAAKVRSVANGNETVPTVFVGDVALVNPSVKQVKAALAAQAS